MTDLINQFVEQLPEEQRQYANKLLNDFDQYQAIQKVEKMKGRFTVESILQAVADFFKTTPDVIKSRSRKTETVVFPRQWAHYFSRRLTKESLFTVGAKIGYMDHASIVHGCKCIQQRISAYPDQLHLHWQIEKYIYNFHGRTYDFPEPDRKEKKIEPVITKATLPKLQNHVLNVSMDCKEVVNSSCHIAPNPFIKSKYSQFATV